MTGMAGAEPRDCELCLLWRCSPGALGSLCGPEGGCLSEPGKRPHLLHTPGVRLALGRLERTLQLVPDVCTIISQDVLQADPPELEPQLLP